MGYFDQNAGERGPARRTYAVTEDLLHVLAADTLPVRLRPLAAELGAGSALSSPPLLQRDIVNLWGTGDAARNVRGPATAALLGGSVSADGELDATGVAFSVSGGFVGFVTFAIPAALLVPGGGFYVAYRLYRLVRDTSALRRFARVSRAAPHVAIAVAASDAEITADEARLLRDLLRARVGSHAERFGLLKLELDPASKQEAALDALRAMDLSTDDWPALLAIAIATAHADDEYSGEEREVIHGFRGLTDLSDAEFSRLAAEAEEDYMLRCHLGEATVRAAHQIACAGQPAAPDDAKVLLEIVLCAAVPGDSARLTLTRQLVSREASAMTHDELTKGASTVRPTLFRRVAGARSQSRERVEQYVKTLALFLATLEQWRGWVVRDCRTELLAIGKQHGISERRTLKWLRAAHHNVEVLRRDWIAPRPWETPQSDEVEIVVRELTTDAYGVTGLPGGRFVFQQGETHWEWTSGGTRFDAFVRTTLSIEVAELLVQSDDMTFELLLVMVEAHESEIRVVRAMVDS